jgi:dihydrofolate reductase
MGRLLVFNQVSLDGYFAGLNGDIGWAKKDPNDAEWNAFVAGNARGGGMLLFGRITYELMASYWPTPDAIQNDPVVAGLINRRPKVVFSRTLDKVSWSNTKLVKGGLEGEVRRMKEQAEKGIAILGSGSLVAQLSQEGLIDEYQLVVTPVVLGAGKNLFEGIKKKLNLKLTGTRTFSNGSVLMSYIPAI